MYWLLYSADSDLLPPLELIQEDTDIKTAVVLPRKFVDDPEKRRPLNRQLTETLNHEWVREYIHEDELSVSILPKRVGRDGKKHIDCPKHWH